MSKHTCLCLRCGAVTSVEANSDKDLNDKPCPACKGKNLVKYKTNDLFRGVFGSYSYGGG